MLDKTMGLGLKSSRPYFIAAMTFLAAAYLVFSISLAYTNIKHTMFVQWSGIAVSTLFLVIVALFWTKALSELYNVSFSSENAALYMTLPVSEAEMVLSKIIPGTVFSFFLFIEAILLSGMAALFHHNLGGSLIAVVQPFVDGGQSAGHIAVVFALLPVTILTTEMFFCSLLLTLRLVFFRGSRTSKSSYLLVLLVVVVQISGCALLIKYYGGLAAEGLNMIVVQALIVLVFAGLFAAMIKKDINILKNGYDI